MTTTVTIVLRKEFEDDDKDLPSAASGWCTGGWVLAGAEFVRNENAGPTYVLQGMLIAEAERQRKRADVAEAALAAAQALDVQR